MHLLSVDDLILFVSQILLEVSNGLVDVLLLNKFLQNGLIFHLQHVAMEVGNLQSVVLHLVVAGRHHYSKALVGLRLIENRDEHSTAIGYLSSCKNYVFDVFG